MVNLQIRLKVGLISQGSELETVTQKKKKKKLLMSDLLCSRTLVVFSCNVLPDSYSSVLCSVSLRAEGNCPAVKIKLLLTKRVDIKHPALLKHTQESLDSFKCSLKYTEFLINRRLLFFIQAQLQREHLFEIDLPSASFNVLLNSAT